MKTNKIFIFRKSIAKYVKTVAAGALLLAGSSAVLADYPKRPVSLVIPFGSGGATDISARVLTQAVAKYASRPIVIVNREGAGGAVGSANVANSKPNGYTMLAVRAGSQAVGPAMKSDLPYSLDDFNFVGIYELNPIVCAANISTGINSMADLVAQIDAKPGEHAYTSSGVGSMQQLASIMILDAFGVENPLDKTVHLPMRGGGGAATSILNGSGSFLCENSSVIVSFIEAGQLVPLLVTSKERLPGIDAPTAAELGHPELEVLLGWTGIAGPKNLDSSAMTAWSEWLSKAADDPQFIEKMEALGSEVVSWGPDETRSFIDMQFAAFVELVDKFDMRIN